MKNKITDIKPQVKHDGRFSVFINDKFAFGISELEMLKFSLSSGMELSDKKLNEILLALDVEKCQDYANSLVCARMYTKKELKRKLSTKGYSDETVNVVISRLAEYGYVDDFEYAKLYISEMKQKFGVYKLKQKLYEKGISSEILDRCFEDFENKDVAVKHLKTKLRGRRYEKDDIPKLLRFLAQKGFTFDESQSALRTYMEDLDAENYE